MAAKSRRRSWGSITSKGRGTYVLRWMQNTPEGRKRCTKTVHGTYREACLELDRLHVELAEDAPVPTVGRAWELWASSWLDRAEASGRLSTRTVEAYRRAWRLHVEPRWGRCPVTQVAPYAVQEWLLTMTPAVADQNLKTLRLVYRQAARWTGCPDPVNGMTYEMPTGGPTRDKRIYTGAELRAVADHLAGSCVEAPYLLASAGGLRTGEALGVKASEVERIEDAGLVYVAIDVVRQMPTSGIEPLPDGELKTSSSLRTVVIPPPVSVRLMELADAAWLWVADRGDGLPMSRDTLRHRWDKVMADAPVPRIPFSNLRTSWRTAMTEELHMPWEVCEQLMGHALPGVSGQHYLRPTRDQQVRAALDAFREHLGH